VRITLRETTSPPRQVRDVDAGHLTDHLMNDEHPNSVSSPDPADVGRSSSSIGLRSTVRSTRAPTHTPDERDDVVTPAIWLLVGTQGSNCDVFNRPIMSSASTPTATTPAVATPTETAAHRPRTVTWRVVVSKYIGPMTRR